MRSLEVGIDPLAQNIALKFRVLRFSAKR